MAIKFEKIKAGMVLYDRHREQTGDTTLRRIGEWRVKIIEVNSPARPGGHRSATVSWNGNRPELWWEDKLVKLYDWSMYDKSVAEVTEGFGGAICVRRLTKAERKALAVGALHAEPEKQRENLQDD